MIPDPFALRDDASSERKDPLARVSQADLGIDRREVDATGRRRSTVPLPGEKPGAAARANHVPLPAEKPDVPSRPEQRDCSAQSAAVANAEQALEAAQSQKEYQESVVQILLPR